MTTAASGTRHHVTLIVARARNGIIGRENALVWHLPEDLRQFRATTMNHALIVGRKTWESIGRPLPGRRMIIVSRNTAFDAPGCESAPSVGDAIALAATATAAHPEPAAEIFVAGGAQTYRHAFAWATRVLITHVDLAPDGDVSFSWPLAPVWKCLSQVAHESSNGTRYRVEDWRRDAPARSLPVASA